MKKEEEYLYIRSARTQAFLCTIVLWMFSTNKKITKKPLKLYQKSQIQNKCGRVRWTRYKNFSEMCQNHDLREVFIVLTVPEMILNSRRRIDKDTHFIAVLQLGSF